jgi:hypothetical protein
MYASDTAIGVVLGACMMVTSVVVTLANSCESTEEREIIARKIEPRILAHIQTRNSLGSTEKWILSVVKSTGPSPQICF